MINLTFTKYQCHYLENFLRQRVPQFMDLYLKLHDALRANKTEVDSFPITVNVTVEDIMNTMEAIGSRQEKLYGQINRQLKDALQTQLMPSIGSAVAVMTAYQTAVHIHTNQVQALQAAHQEELLTNPDAPAPTLPTLVATPPNAEQTVLLHLAQKFQEWEAIIDGNLQQEVAQSKSRYL